MQDISSSGSDENDIIAQRKAADAKFRKILVEECDFEVVEMDKDGNCLFRCLAQVGLRVLTV